MVVSTQDRAGYTEEEIVSRKPEVGCFWVRLFPTISRSAMVREGRLSRHIGNVNHLKHPDK